MYHLLEDAKKIEQDFDVANSDLSFKRAVIKLLSLIVAALVFGLSKDD